MKLTQTQQSHSLTLALTQSSAAQALLSTSSSRLLQHTRQQIAIFRLLSPTSQPQQQQTAQQSVPSSQQQTPLLRLHSSAALLLLTTLSRRSKIFSMQKLLTVLLTLTLKRPALLQQRQFSQAISPQSRPLVLQQLQQFRLMLTRTKLTAMQTALSSALSLQQQTQPRQQHVSQVTQPSTLAPVKPQASALRTPLVTTQCTGVQASHVWNSPLMVPVVLTFASAYSLKHKEISNN